MRLRNFLLRADVISTAEESDALARIERGDCGVLLMCYSLVKSVRQRLAEVLRKFCHGARIVAIGNEHMEKPDFADTVSCTA